jgi:hypothetical protein
MCTPAQGTAVRIEVIIYLYDTHADLLWRFFKSNHQRIKLLVFESIGTIID